MVTSLELSEKEGQIHNILFGKKIMKIGLADSEIIGLQLKNEQITAIKTYSPPGKHAGLAKRKKLHMHILAIINYTCTSNETHKCSLASLSLMVVLLS